MNFGSRGQCNSLQAISISYDVFMMYKWHVWLIMIVDICILWYQDTSTKQQWQNNYSMQCIDWAWQAMDKIWTHSAKEIVAKKWIMFTYSSLYHQWRNGNILFLPLWFNNILKTINQWKWKWIKSIIGSGLGT